MMERLLLPACYCLLLLLPPLGLPFDLPSSFVSQSIFISMLEATAW
jgi:hypothetical protein